MLFSDYIGIKTLSKNNINTLESLETVFQDRFTDAIKIIRYTNSLPWFEINMYM